LRNQLLPVGTGTRVCSKRALKLAIAEMYVQGVSTRELTDVMRELWRMFDIQKGEPPADLFQIPAADFRLS
jgi:transposase-like protein